MSAPRSAKDAIEEQAAARAVAYLASYFDEGKRRGDPRYLERARKALDEALEAQSAYSSGVTAAKPSGSLTPVA